MIKFDPDKFQGEVVKWAAHSFPRAQLHEPLLGVVEEIGELYEAFYLQNSSKAPVIKESEIDDAVGDIMIFLAHYCGLNGYDIMDCVDKYGREQEAMFAPFALSDVVMAAGRLCQAHLKSAQGVRGNRHAEAAKRYVGHIVGALRILCELQKQDLTEVIGDVWSEVKKRDWKKFPKDGGYEPKPRVRKPLPKKINNDEVPF